MGIISSIVLIAFGGLILLALENSNTIHLVQEETSVAYMASFSSAFVLTISSPLTIVFWTGIFAEKALTKNYSKPQLVIFGMSAGFATLLFLGASIIIFSSVKTSIPLTLVGCLNLAVGAILLLYGIIRLYKICSDKSKS